MLLVGPGTGASKTRRLANRQGGQGGCGTFVWHDLPQSSFWGNDHGMGCDKAVTLAKM